MKAALGWVLVAATPFVAFSLQGPFTHYKLAALGCEAISPTIKSSSCSGNVCYTEYHFNSQLPYLVLGHIVRSHKTMDSRGNLIHPISRISSPLAETWPDLHVYKTPKDSHVIVKAEYPGNAKLTGFSGIKPRMCPQADVVSVPAISPSLHLLAHCLMGLLLAIAVVCANIAVSQSVQRTDQTRSYLIGTLCLYWVTLLLGTHLFDSVKVGNVWMTYTIRTLGVFGMALPLLGGIPIKFSKRVRSMLFLGVCGISLVAAVFGRITLPVELALYPVALLIICTTSFLVVTKRHGPVASVLYSPLLLDVLRVWGIGISDFPPVYWHLLSLGGYGLMVSWQNGASETVPLVKRAYTAILRDFYSLRIASFLEDVKSTGENEVTTAIENALRTMPSALSCSRITLAVLFPDRPVTTFTFDETDDSFSVYNDGELKGAILTRVLLYAESFWFKSIESLNADGFKNLNPKESLKGAKYFCALPLLVNGQVIGVLALTRFRDKEIESPTREHLTRELKNRILIISKQLEHFIQARMLGAAQSTSELISRINSGITDQASSQINQLEFLRGVVATLASEASAQVMLFSRTSPDNAELVCSYGLSSDEVDAWSERPIQLTTASGNRIGPVVVAFREGRPSYIRNISEIFPQLHQHSVDLLSKYKVASFITLPIACKSEEYVLVLFSRKAQGSLSTIWTTVLSEVSTTIVAHLRAVNHASDVEAFGRLALRLVGDSSIRNEILSTARTGDLPPTIGGSRTSFILVVDIMGSTGMKALSSEEKAHRYGQFYNDVQTRAHELLGATMRKHNGDGVILSLPSGNAFNLESFIEFSKACNNAASAIRCDGARIAIHHGSYFCGLIGTKSSGQIDVIGEAIDKACKLEDAMKGWKQFNMRPKIGISSAALAHLQKLGVISNGFPTPSGVSSLFGEYYVFVEAEDLRDFPNRLVSPVPTKAAA